MSNLESYVKDWIKRCEKALAATADEITRETELAYRRCIDTFYESYSPTRYNRTFSTYRASNQYMGFANNIGGTGSGLSYNAGITVDSGNIGSPYRADTDWVFTRTFVKGYHGYNQKEASAWSQREHNKERKIRFRISATVMNPAPKVLMDREFKKICKKKHIDALFYGNL